jgi:hypothetical protein
MRIPHLIVEVVGEVLWVVLLVGDVGDIPVGRVRMRFDVASGALAA